ncbi:MAG: hypothetical protein ACYCXF_07255 [Thermoleophilia bacterium]
MTSGWVGAPSITASYEDYAGSGIDISTVAVRLDGQDITAACHVGASQVYCNSSTGLSGVLPGPHSLTVSVSDLAGNQAIASSSFSYDNTIPHITIMSPTQWSSINNPVIEINATDPESGVVPESLKIFRDADNVQLAGCTTTVISPYSATISCPTAGLPEGLNRYHVQVNSETASSAFGFGFIVDTVAPVVTIHQPAGWVGDSVAMIQADYSDVGTGVVKKTYILDGVEQSNTSCWGQDCFTNLTEGPHSFVIKAEDRAGNVGIGTGSFQVDLTAPSVTITSPAGTVSATGAVLEADLADSGSGIDPGTASVWLDSWLPVIGCTASASHVSCPLPGLSVGHHTVTVSVSDITQHTVYKTTGFDVVVNRPPVLSAVPGMTVNEGSWASTSGTVSDPDNDPVTLTASAGTITVGPGGAWSWSMLALDGPAVQSVTVTADDGRGGITRSSFDLNISNVAPVVGAVTAPVDPLPVGTAVTANSGFGDPGVNDTHIASIGWGDGATTVGGIVESGGTGVVTGNHIYTVAGVYLITVRVTDKDAGTGESVSRYVVIYDPGAGFVTGGGWIDSPPGAFPTDPGVVGRANFGFNSAYARGVNVPTGQTEFQFKAGNLNFHSSSYDWLVVNNSKAQYKGTGTINGIGSYGFMLTAVDGSQYSTGGPDRFRIKIWNKDSGALLYDNQIGQDDNAEPSTALGGGSIIIHKS